MKKHHIKIIVQGNVQGVFYRQSVAAEARRLGVSGYAQNLANGQVLVAAWGEEAALKKLVAFCRLNPGYSEVEEVMVEWGEGGKSDYNDFSIKQD